MSNDKLITRYYLRDRVQHWVVAISFVLLALGGLALFHPAFFWFTNLFGGGTWTRILHPFLGLVLAASFFHIAWYLASYNRMTDADRQWLKRARDVFAKRTEGLPEAGRYNAAQKRLFWVMVVSIAVLLVTGVVLWQPYFAPLFPIWLARLAVLVHAITAFVIITGIIGHVYMAIWTTGSVGAMVRGTVTHAWAKHHHPAWYRDITKGAK